MRGSLTGNFVRKTGDTMTGDLVISKANPVLKMVDTSGGGNSDIAYDNSGGIVARVRFDNVLERFMLRDESGATDRVRWNKSDGKYITGTVPLARMGTVVLDSSTSVLANTEAVFSLGADANEHRFYICSARVDGNLQPTHIGAKVTVTETVEITIHTVVSRDGAGGFANLKVMNGTATARTVVYKVYKLTEI